MALAIGASLEQSVRAWHGTDACSPVLCTLSSQGTMHTLQHTRKLCCSVSDAACTRQDLPVWVRSPKVRYDSGCLQFSL